MVTLYQIFVVVVTALEQNIQSMQTEWPVILNIHGHLLMAQMEIDRRFSFGFVGLLVVPRSQFYGFCMFARFVCPFHECIQVFACHLSGPKCEAMYFRLLKWCILITSFEWFVTRFQLTIPHRWTIIHKYFINRSARGRLSCFHWLNYSQFCSFLVVISSVVSIFLAFFLVILCLCVSFLVCINCGSCLFFYLSKVVWLFWTKRQQK